MSQAAKQMAALKLDEIYPMDKPTMGRALIINNHKFKDQKLNRPGSEIDAANLQSLLRDMGFIIDVEENVTGEKLEMAIESFKDMKNHKDSNAAFLCMMSHGTDAGLLCVDYTVKPWDDLTNCLNSVYTLIDKPKIILVNACRGELKDIGQVQCDATTPHIYLPTGSDVFLMFATVKDKVEWETPTGSFLVRNLVPVFREHYQTMDLSRMFTLVKARVAAEVAIYEDVTYKQAAQAVDTLCKVFFFFK